MRMDVFKLTLVRHGETLENKLKIIQGHKDTVLSEKGIKQAELLAKRLENEIFTHVYSSDLCRARQTCEIILNQNKKTQAQLIIDTRLRERKLGTLEGHPVSKLKGLKLDAKPGVGGIESKQQVRQHAKSFFKDLCAVVEKPSLLVKDPLTVSQRSMHTSESGETKGIQKLDFPLGAEVVQSPGAASVSLESSNVCVCSTSVKELKTTGYALPSSTKHSSSEAHKETEETICDASKNSNLKLPSVAEPPDMAIHHGLPITDSQSSNSLTDLAEFKSDAFASALIVSHGGLLTELISYFVKELRCKIPESQRSMRYTVPNAGISRFLVGMNEGSKFAPKIVCLSLFETDHLTSEGEDFAPLDSSSADFI